MSQESSGRITGLLGAVSAGSPEAARDLLQLVYAELHSVASRKVRRVPHDTLNATALVNEVYLRLFGEDTPPRWENRRHFFYAASRAMRDILVERARAAVALKRGGGVRPSPMTEEPACFDTPPEEVLALGGAIDRLAMAHQRAAEVVTLRFFGGLEYEEIAAALDISNATARRDWTFARAWLHKELEKDDRG